ncbi:NAD(P)/FAD-dependent oxidoreductase [Streptomyces sp. DT2A-34]|uniref:phytoene desaturase family protein n=1 Tax=Streptomyces sp. DT2A-34 TaxID=3051182 RepID=UPI00265BC1C4|nr:NAD(P)/FAD-dependent oxidoreductase [Streptomyces sp. DT2A-34]MDO0916646.1 NAD(P)/FAD-dependent oxidoreductase [Streptomyces sp. DT2A-34]
MKAGQSYKRSTVADSWDAIVIGSGAGGLTAAGFLARSGQRVLLLERHTTAGGAIQTFRRAGYEWDAGLHYMGEVHRPGSGLRRIFDHITGGKLGWAPMPDVYNRIFVEDREYEIPSGADRFKERLIQYFPDEAEAISRYVDLVFAANRAAKPFFAQRSLPQPVAQEHYEAMCAPFRSFSDRTVTEVLAELTDDEELKTVLCGHFGDYSMTPGRVSFAMHAMLIRHYIDGANFPVGGSGRITETISDVIRAAGGDVLIAAEVDSVRLDEQGRACGVTMTDGRAFDAPVVISDAGALNTLTRLLPADAKRDDELVDACRAIGPSLTWVVLNIGIKESADQLELSGSNIWAHQGPDVDAQFALYESDPQHRPMPAYFLTCPSAKDPQWNDRYPGRSTIDIAGVTTWSLFEPFADSAWMRRGVEYEQLKQRLSRELLDQVLRFYPKAEGKIDHMELATPLSFNHFLGRTHGDFMSLAHTPERFAQRGLSAHTLVPGLFLSGQDVAAAGVSGAVVGGVVAASAVLGRDALGDM